MGSPLSPTLEALLARIILDDVMPTSNPEVAKADQYYSAGYNSCIDQLIGEWDTYIEYCSRLTAGQQQALEYLLAHQLLIMILRQQGVLMYLDVDRDSYNYFLLSPDVLETLKQIHLDHGIPGLSDWIKNNITASDKKKS